MERGTVRAIASAVAKEVVIRGDLRGQTGDDGAPAFSPGAMAGRNCAVRNGLVSMFACQLAQADGTHQPWSEAIEWKRFSRYASRARRPPITPYPSMSGAGACTASRCAGMRGARAEIERRLDGSH